MLYKSIPVFLFNIFITQIYYRKHHFKKLELESHKQLRRQILIGTTLLNVAYAIYIVQLKTLFGSFKLIEAKGNLPKP